ncbi:MAG: SPOR domain-containing protein [Boseongicola sp.]
MAAINFEDYGRESDGGTLQSIVNWAGAILSVLLIVGLATWGWKLWQRDVTGVPVVRALEGPMRVTPDDPGGQASEYQGLAVNRIAEERVEDVVDSVVLAPAPSTLNEKEDLPMSELVTAKPPEALPEIAPDQSPAFVENAGEKLTSAPETAALAKEPSATDLAVAAALADVVELQPTIVSLSDDDVANGVPLASPRPQSRPADRRVAALSPVMNDVTGEIEADSIPPGTRLVQLGAYGSPEVARTEWANAMAQFGDYMTGKERVVQEAETGGRKFWRLRATGFTSLSDARRFCAVLVSDGANCIPVVQE